jgi:acetoin utilization deacetylase AcuC-like enzyme
MQVVSRMEFILSAGNITDHRSSVLGLAEHRPGFVVTEDGSDVRLSDESGSVDFTSDEQRRITGATMSLHGA